MKRAVIYLRVSDPSQVDNNSLETQEKICKSFAKRQDTEVVTIFNEKGVSAKTFDRPEMRKLMAFCTTRKNAIDYVLVYKFDRWTRNVNEGLSAVALLSKFGVQLISATEPSEQDPYGTFVRTMMMATAQLDNEIKGERVKSNMETVFKNGLWCWKPPIGYKRPFRDKERNKGLPPIQDKRLAPMIELLFQDASSGVYTLTQLTKKLDTAEFREAYGRPPTVNLVSKVVKNSFYYGMMYAKKWDVYQAGQHKPLTTEYIWKKANNALFAKKTTYQYQDSEKYPLKGLLIAQTTQRYLTSSNPTGKIKKHYYYERDDTRIPIRDAHKQFKELLKHIKPTKRVLKLFQLMVFSEWDNEINRVKSLAQKYVSRIEKLKLELKRVSITRSEGIYTAEEARHEATDIRNEISILEVELGDIKFYEYDTEIVKNFTEYFLLNLDRFWELADLPLKQTLQNKIFPKGIEITRERNIRTPKLSPLFELIQTLNDENSYNVTLTGVSLNQF